MKICFLKQSCKLEHEWKIKGKININKNKSKNFITIILINSFKENFMKEKTEF